MGNTVTGRAALGRLIDEGEAIGDLIDGGFGAFRRVLDPETGDFLDALPAIERAEVEAVSEAVLSDRAKGIISGAASAFFFINLTKLIRGGNADKVGSIRPVPVQPVPPKIPIPGPIPPPTDEKDPFPPFPRPIQPPRPPPEGPPSSPPGSSSKDEKKRFRVFRFEQKWRDHTVDLDVKTGVYPVFINPTGDCVNGIPSGVSENTRIGSRVLINSILIRGHFLLEPKVTTLDLKRFSDELLLISIVLDEQPNGAVPDIRQIYDNESGDGYAAAHPLRNLYYTSRFKVLFTKKYPTPPLVVGRSDPVRSEVEFLGSMIPVTIYERVGKVVQFSGDAGNIVDIARNAIHLIAGKSTSGSDRTVKFRGLIRVTFRDVA